MDRQVAKHHFEQDRQTMKKLCFFYTMLAIMVLACNLPLKAMSIPETATPGLVDSTQYQPTQPPATEMPGDTTTAPSPVAPGNGVKIGNFSFVIPTGLASTASHEVIQRAEGDQVPPWEIAPEHTVITLENYNLPGRQLKPQIFIYPAGDYAKLNEGVAENIKKIKALTSGAGMDVNNDTLPHIPFYNAAQVFAAQTQTFKFLNGSGVRFITQYGQDVGPITNNGLFYHYEGLSDDGNFYILAIFPLSASILADGSGQLPEGGVPFPDYNDPNANFPAYYDIITQKLNTMSPDTFSPVLTQLDALVQTIKIVP
jgi:hypothetical protein